MSVLPASRVQELLVDCMRQAGAWQEGGGMATGLDMHANCFLVGAVAQAFQELGYDLPLSIAQVTMSVFSKQHWGLDVEGVFVGEHGVGLKATLEASAAGSTSRRAEVNIYDAKAPLDVVKEKLLSHAHKEASKAVGAMKSHLERAILEQGVPQAQAAIRAPRL